MRKYHGTLVHKLRDELGEIEVVDDAAYRSLHFGTESKQSSMLLRDPIHLALAYTRAMTAALLFSESHRRFLLIGLGGGSLAKFLLHHFSDCHIDAVEYRQTVTAVAHSHFQLPQDERLSIHIDDGGHFMRNADMGRFGNYDGIFVDAFLGKGIARSVCGMSFYDACRDRLAKGGVLSINLWSGDFISARDMLEDIGHSFDGNILQLPVDGKDNIIALAGRGMKLKTQLRKLGERHKALEQQTGVEYTLLYRQLRKANSWLSLP
jgi:spermidine synthase